MSFVNRMTKEVNCKIVYYGAGLCGKTANLNYIFAATKPESRGKMISLETETERTLFFDFLPLDLGKIGEYKVRFHLYTVPGQVFYDASRRLILKGCDGIIFVADSQEARAEANIESLENLEQNLASHNFSLANMPHGLCMFDQDQRLLICNERYADMYRVPKDMMRPGTTTVTPGMVERMRWRSR